MDSAAISNDKADAHPQSPDGVVGGSAWDK